MKILPLASAILIVLTVGAIMVAVRQRERLTALRVAYDLVDVSSGQRPEPPRSPKPVSHPTALSATEHEELLKLRGQVRPLLDQLASRQVDSQRHTRLEGKIAELQRAKAPPGPGYLSRAGARNLGNATPEATMETFLWAIQNRDSNVLFRIMGPQMRESMERQLADQGSEKFFKESFVISGFRIVGAKALDAETAELTFEPLPGESVTVKFHHENGGWVMNPE